MKPLLLTAVFIFSGAAMAALDKEPCRTQKNLHMKMSAISSNLANLNTTRTPEGGPYQRRELICKAQYCVVVTRGDFIDKHEPAHPDANEEGIVRYPKINVEKEMNAFQQANREYRVATRNCRNAKLAKND